MGANTEKITIRLTPEQVENIDTIMLNRDVKSRSKVIRLAIENFISENLIDISSQKVIVNIPNNTMNRLVDCVSAGDILNIETAMQLSLDRYLNSIDDYYITKRKSVLDARLEYQSELAVKAVAKESLKK